MATWGASSIEEAEITPMEPGQVMLLRDGASPIFCIFLSSRLDLRLVLRVRIIGKNYKNIKHMKILINNQETETKSVNVLQLAAELDLPERGVALAINNKIVSRPSWIDTNLTEGDKVTIIKAAFGG